VNIEAQLGFRILGADAKQAVPALMKLYERNISHSSQNATGHSLTAIGPAARMAIPLFVRGTASSDADVRRNAVEALMEIHAEPQLVVPALVKSLSDTNYSVRMLATIGLGYFGTNAQQAVPALVPMLSDPDLDIRRTAAYDLEAIDPGAAAKAGVK
jgi:HEAT repeat protein